MSTKQKILTLSVTTFALLLMGAGCGVNFGPNKNQPQTSGPSGIFLSTDNGEKWQPQVSLPSLQGVKSIAGVDIYRIIVDPNDEGTMYLASRANGLFYTYNDGNSWQHASGALSSGFIYAVSVHPKNKCIIYVSNGSRIFRTDDCSRTWEEVYRESRSDVRVQGLTFAYGSPYKVYAVETNGDLLQSYDGSGSWSVIHRFSKRLNNVITHPLDENLIYIISASDNIYRSTDGGANWVNLGANMKNYPGANEYRRHLLDNKDVNKLYWVSTYGILISTDRGDTWTDMKLITPPGSAKIYAFAVNPKDSKEIYYTATINSRSTLYRSTDGGVNWVTRKLPSGQIPVYLRVHPDHDGWLYVAFSKPTA